MNRNEINVHIGEVKTGSKGNVLHALLGSCVGIAILWPERDIYGLAHCLLSESPDKDYPLGGKYVDQAIHTLLKVMNITVDDYKKVRAIVAGGGNMTKSENTDVRNLVGYRNSKLAIDLLLKLKIEIIYQDIGGTNGRKMSINCLDESFNIKTIPRPQAA